MHLDVGSASASSVCWLMMCVVWCVVWQVDVTFKVDVSAEAVDADCAVSRLAGGENRRPVGACAKC